MFHFKKTLLITTLFLGTTLIADTIELRNGSKIIGEIISYTKEKLVVATDFAGELKIDSDKIKAIYSHNPLMIETEDGTIVRTTLPKDGENKVQYSPISGRFSLDDCPIRKIVSHNSLESKLISEPEPIKETSPWTFKVGLNLSAREGKTDLLTFSNTLEAYYSKNDNSFKIYQNGGYSDGKNQDKEFYSIIGVDSEYRLNSYFSAYFRDVIRKDQDKNLNISNTIAVGFGHYFLKKKAGKEEISFRLRSGIGHVYKDYDTSQDASELSFDASLYFYYKKEKYVFSSELIWEPTIENLQDYRIYQETKVEVPLGLLKNMSLQLGVTQEYLSVTDEDENLDTLIYSRLLFSW